MRERGGQGWLAGVMAIVLACVVAVDLPAAGQRPAKVKHALANCFWEGPISTKRKTTRGFNGRYFNFPEESATYWMARFDLPAGAKLVLSGRYPHGRYMSLNTYADGEPTDALSDIAIRPKKGSTNPFVTGKRRDQPRRSWAVTVIDERPPGGDRPRNTIYGGG